MGLLIMSVSHSLEKKNLAIIKKKKKESKPKSLDFLALTENLSGNFPEGLGLISKQVSVCMEAS